MKDVQPITLGHLIAILERRPQEQEVAFDFGHFAPDGIASYRAYYDHLAIGYKEFEYKSEPRVRQFLDELRGAIGKTFEGYKGGDFRMHPNTPMWVANYGECPGTAAVDLAECDYKTVIATGYCDNWSGGMQRAMDVLRSAQAFR